MKLLAFETASPSGGVALCIDGEIVQDCHYNDSKSHSRRCLKDAEDILEASGLQWSDIDCLGTSIGPGSFTGVRVGVTLVKGLCYSLDKPCVAVSSLESLALGSHCGETR